MGCQHVWCNSTSFLCSALNTLVSVTSVPLYGLFLTAFLYRSLGRVCVCSIQSAPGVYYFRGACVCFKVKIQQYFLPLELIFYHTSHTQCCLVIHVYSFCTRRMQFSSCPREMTHFLRLVLIIQNDFNSCS